MKNEKLYRENIFKLLIMKKIQINNDKLPVFTFQIDKNKDKICNFDKNRKMSNPWGILETVQCCSTNFSREYLALFNSILLPVLFDSEILLLGISSTKIFTHVYTYKFQWS